MAYPISTAVTEKFECPKCHQPPGSYCRRPSGRKADFTHTERMALATPEIIEAASLTRLTLTVNNGSTE